jgi:hypothetical protein
MTNEMAIRTIVAYAVCFGRLSMITLKGVWGVVGLRHVGTWPQLHAMHIESLAAYLLDTRLEEEAHGPDAKQRE